MTTTFDTSGAVPLPHPTPEDAAGKWASDPVLWTDLSPFTQGYIKALIQDFGLQYWNGGESDDTPDYAAFSDLAPETLAQIVADCEEFSRLARVPNGDTTAQGRALWVERQAGRVSSSRPLTVQLGDDGKVRFA